MRLSHLQRFHDQTRTAKKVLAVELGFLGDVLQLVPALWEIHRHYPSAALHVLSSTLGAEALSLVPCVERPWAVHLKQEQRSLGEHLRVLRALRAERFDVAFNFNSNDRSVILTGLIGPRRRVGAAGGRQHFWKTWLQPDEVSTASGQYPVFEQRRQFLAGCGFQLDQPRFDLRVPEEDLGWAAAQVPAGALHLSLNSANPYKEWPLEHHARLLEILWAQRPELRVLASTTSRPREIERLQVLATRLHDPRLVLLPPEFSLRRLAAVLTRCRLHLGPDSGVMHLAVALQVPTISFFRDYGTFNGWMPRGTIHRVLSAPCHCVDHHDAPCERLGAPVCLAEIKPETVVAAVFEQLDRPGAAGSPAAAPMPPASPRSLPTHASP